MHEYALIDGILRRAAQETRLRGAAGVRTVHLCVGELSGVDPDLLRTAYEMARAGTVCANADLELTRIRAVFVCPTCDRKFESDETLTCPRCGTPARLADGGDALLLDRLDLEVT